MTGRKLLGYHKQKTILIEKIISSPNILRLSDLPVCQLFSVRPEREAVEGSLLKGQRI
jgi:hypothetical protein